VTLDATVGKVSGSTKQTTVVTNPVGGFGPSITSLIPTNVSGGGGGGGSLVLTDSILNVAKFAATTSSPAAEVNWAINGDVQGKASGSGTSWNFGWNLSKTKPDGATVFPDCTYL